MRGCLHMKPFPPQKVVPLKATPNQLPSNWWLGKWWFGGGELRASSLNPNHHPPPKGYLKLRSCLSLGPKNHRTPNHQRYSSPSSATFCPSTPAPAPAPPGAFARRAARASKSKPSNEEAVGTRFTWGEKNARLRRGVGSFFGLS